jgi:hypothetical protein
MEPCAPGSVEAGDRRNPESRVALLVRIAREFREMAGLSLTLAQASRLFHLDADLCQRVFAELAERGVVKRGSEEGSEGQLTHGDSAGAPSHDRAREIDRTTC